MGNLMGIFIYLGIGLLLSIVILLVEQLIRSENTNYQQLTFIVNGLSCRGTRRDKNTNFDGNVQFKLNSCMK